MNGHLPAQPVLATQWASRIVGIENFSEPCYYHNKVAKGKNSSPGPRTSGSRGQTPYAPITRTVDRRELWLRRGGGSDAESREGEHLCSLPQGAGAWFTAE